MVANNLLEIYTLMFAWNMYEAIWDILTGTGLALLPFIAAIVSSFKRNYSEHFGSAKSAIATLEYAVVGMLLMLILCVMPFNGMPVQLATVQYTFSIPDCNPPVNDSGTGDNTLTAYDDGFDDLGGGFEINRPVMWNLVELVSTAITHTTIQSMTCANNYEYMLMRLAQIRINDPELEGRVKEFSSVCYKKAVDEYHANPALAAAVAVAEDGFGTNQRQVMSIDWIGSRLLRNGFVNSFYQAPDAYMADMERWGFTRQPVFRTSDAARATGAHPSCREVWEGEGGAVGAPAPGLRQLLITNIRNLPNNDDAEQIYDAWMNWGSEAITIGAVDPASKEDLLLKMILQAQEANLSNQVDIDLSQNSFDVDRGWWSQKFDEVMGAATMFVSVDEFLKANGVKQLVKIVGPMVLALLQLIIIMSAPFVMVMGHYSLQTFVQLALSYFALEFVNAIWAVSYWFDQRVLDIYLSQNGWLTDPSAAFIINAVSAGSVILLPLIWLSIMSQAGAGLVRGMGAGMAGGTAGMGGRFMGGSTASGAATKSGVNRAIAASRK